MAYRDNTHISNYSNSFTKSIYTKACMIHKIFVPSPNAVKLQV